MAVKKTFDFKLSQNVGLALSKKRPAQFNEPRPTETGVVIGRSQYTNCNPQYLVRYVAADGRQIEEWLAEDAIVAL
ncbi:hypothetical protein [Rhizobium sp.]|uniref:hypothetical protein n=1 Tax=Rhizobium sp. TaxID=391 RepID=UPI0028B25D07